MAVIELFKTDSFATAFDVRLFARATNYQAALIALQMFLQHNIIMDQTVSYSDILEFYLEKCSTVQEFLACRVVIVYHEDDERDGSEIETPLTCGLAQEVFEHVEKYLHKNWSTDDLRDENPMAVMDAREVFQKPEFKTVVDVAYRMIADVYDATVNKVMLKIFPDDSEHTDGMRRTARSLVRASVFSTDDFFKRFSDEEKDSYDQLFISMNKNCEIVGVSFESLDWISTTLDADDFVDIHIVLKTHDDNRLYSFYKECFEDVELKKMKIKKPRTEEPPAQTTNP